MAWHEVGSGELAQRSGVERLRRRNAAPAQSRVADDSVISKTGLLGEAFLW